MGQTGYRFAILVIAFLALLSLPTLGLAQNVLQVPNVVDSPTFDCPPGGQTASIANLALSLETSGRPVLVMYTVSFVASPIAAVSLTPIIDGVADIGGSLFRHIGDFPSSGQADVVSFARVYSVPEGIHSFGVRVSCQNAVNFTRRWLIAYELPQDKASKGHKNN